MSSETAGNTTPEITRSNILRKLESLFEGPDTVAVAVPPPVGWRTCFIAAGECTYMAYDGEDSTCDVTVSRLENEMFPMAWYRIAYKDEKGEGMTIIDPLFEPSERTATDDEDNLYYLESTVFNKETSRQAARTIQHPRPLSITIPQLIEINLDNAHPEALPPYIPADITARDNN